MSSANFFFHGLFPDYLETSGGTPRQISKVLFDVTFDKEFHSHLLADIWLVENDEKNDIPTFEVHYDLPFECDEFPKAVVNYYQQVIGPQSTTISHSGPKGPIPNKGVYRVQWEVTLDAERKASS